MFFDWHLSFRRSNQNSVHISMARPTDISSFDNPSNIRQEALLLVVKFCKFYLGTFLPVAS
jgi:hypothetical protein